MNHGKKLHQFIENHRHDFHPKDFIQVIIGASILAIPVAYTEETWVLGATLPISSILGFLLLSIFFIAIFTYYNYSKDNLLHHFSGFSTRVVVTYIVSFLLVAFYLTLIQKAPWFADGLLAFKRTVLVTFPASLSAAVVDTLH